MRYRTGGRQVPSRIKKIMLEEIKARYASAESLFFVGYTGLNAQQTHEIRRELGSQGVRFAVVKNSLAARALEELGKGYVFDGPTAVMDGEDPIAVARAAVASGRKNKAIALRGGYVDGKVLEAREVIELSRLPSRPEMLGLVVSAAISAGAGLVSAILAPGSRLAGAIKAKAGS